MELGRINITGKTEEEIEAIKAQFADREGVKVNRKSVSFDEPSLLNQTGGVQSVKVSKIRTDVERFQNRETEFSYDSVKRIVENYDPNKFDPITVWRDKDKTIYVLSGHSRLAAIKQLGFDTIPVKFFNGTEEQAITYAKADANRLATLETFIEDLKAYKLLRFGGKGVKPLSKQEIKDRFPNWSRLEIWSYLNPNGLFIKTLNDPKLKDEAPYLVNRSLWVGDLRKSYGEKLTNAHEDEIFKFFYISPPSGGLPDKEEFYSLMQRKLSRFDFDPSEPLLLTGGETGTQARQDTAPLERRLNELTRLNKRLSEQLRAANTQAEKTALTTEIRDNIAEMERIRRDIGIILKTQTALFGADDVNQYRKDITAKDVYDVFKERPNWFSQLYEKRKGKVVKISNEKLQLKREIYLDWLIVRYNWVYKQMVDNIVFTFDRIVNPFDSVSFWDFFNVFSQRLFFAKVNPNRTYARAKEYEQTLQNKTLFGVGRVIWTGAGSFPYDPEKDPRKPTYKILSDYSHLIGKADKRVTFQGDGDVYQTVNIARVLALKNVEAVRPLAEHLKQPFSLEQTAHNVWHWIKLNIQYEKDTDGREEIRTPQRTFADKKGDCEDMAIFAAALFRALGFNPYFCTVKFTANNRYSHIYTGVGNFIVDCVIDKFNHHPPNVSYTMEQYVLSGVRTEYNGDKGTAGLGSVTEPTVLQGIQDDIITAAKTGLLDRADAAKALRKTRALQLFEGTENQKAFASIMPFIEDVTPKGELVLKEGVDVKTLAQFAVLDHLNRNGLMQDLKGVEGLGAVDSWFDSLKKEAFESESLSGLGKVKAFRKLRERMKKGFKKIGASIKKAGKAVAKGVKNFVKDPVHYLAKVFPVTFVVRNAFRAALAINLFGLSTKIGFGYLTESEAAAKGISLKKLEAYRNGTRKVENLFHKLGGERSVFKKTVLSAMSKKPLLSKDIRKAGVPQTQLQQMEAIAAGKVKVGADGQPLKGLGEILAAAQIAADQSEIITYHMNGQVMGLGEPITISAIVASAGAAIGTAVKLIKDATDAANAVKDGVDTVKSVVKPKAAEEEEEEEETEEEETTDGLGAKKSDRRAKRKAKKDARNKKKTGRKAKRTATKAAKKTKKAAKKTKSSDGELPENGQSEKPSFFERATATLQKATSKAKSGVDKVKKAAANVKNAIAPGFKDAQQQQDYADIVTNDTTPPKSDNTTTILTVAAIGAGLFFLSK